MGTHTSTASTVGGYAGNAGKYKDGARWEMVSPSAAKSQEWTATKQRVKDALADAGPYLQNDGAQIVIPSPAKHPAFNRVLREYGFTFDYSGLGCVWMRDTGRPHQGKRYTPQGWFKWAREHYDKAWRKERSND